MSLYAVALRLLFTAFKGPSPNHENHPWLSCLLPLFLPLALEGARIPSITHSSHHQYAPAFLPSCASAIIGLTWTQLLVITLSFPSLCLFPSSVPYFGIVCHMSLFYPCADAVLVVFHGFCSDMHCQLWDLIYTGVCLSKSCQINWIYHRCTPIKFQKHLKDDQWKQDETELNFEFHGKGSEYLCK